VHAFVSTDLLSAAPRQKEQLRRRQARLRTPGPRRSPPVAIIAPLRAVIRTGSPKRRIVAIAEVRWNPIVLLNAIVSRPLDLAGTRDKATTLSVGGLPTQSRGNVVRVVVPRAARAGDLHRVATQSCGLDAAHERFVVVRVARQALTRFVRAALHRVASRRPTLCSRLLGPVNLVRNAGFAATTGVSCAPASSCTAAIGGGVGTFNGSSWSGPVCPGGDPSSLSCPSSAFCLAGDSTGHVIRDDDGSWGAPVSVDPGPAFRCPAPAARSAPLSMRTGMR
jgi:hypothetical protein